jgi:hypothetical protein
MRARSYISQTGSFTTRDPAFAVTDTAYTYGGGDPVNQSDPLGLWPRLSDLNPVHDVQQAWNDTGGKAVSYVNQHQTAFEVGAGVVLGVAAAATGVGAVVEAGIAVGVEGAAATAALSASSELGLASLVTGAGATALDGNGCIGSHDAVACVGFALGGTALLAGGAGEIGTNGILGGWITSGTLPEAAFLGTGAFGSLFGVAGSIFDSVYGLSTFVAWRSIGDG